MRRLGRVLVWLSLCLGLRMGMVVTIPAEAHPGRLNAEGCHWVVKPWVSKEGRRVEAGDFHCHRALGQLTLDQRERLQDPNDPGREEQLTQEEQERQ